MADWLRMLKGDPLPWLLEADTPAVRHLALRHLFEQPADAPAVRQARAAAMQTDPIATILAAEQPEGFWLTLRTGRGPAGSRDRRGRAIGGTGASPTGTALRDGSAPPEPFWRQRGKL